MRSGIKQLENAFKENWNKTAVEDAERSWTFNQLFQKSNSLSLKWKSSLQSGDRVLILPGDRLEYIASVIACSLGGFDPVLVSEKATEEEVEYITNKTQPALVWSGGEVDDVEVNTDAVTFNDVPFLFFTSGTTGKPKGVNHYFESFVSNAISFNRHTDLDESTRMLHVMPIGYMAGLLNTIICPLVAGGTVVMGDAFTPAVAMGLWKFSMEKDVNSMWLSPTMVATLTKLCRGDDIPTWAKGTLKRVFVGTAPLHEATRKNFKEKLGVDCLQSYGMTECMLISVFSENDPLEGSVGTPIGGVEVESRGEDESIWIKSDFMSTGYLLENETELTPLEMESGWLNSGDIGTVDEEKKILITGRHKDLIIKGGLNISPKSIENTILSYPGISEVAVVGIPHEFWGEDVLACVQPDKGSELDLNELKLHCRNHLAKDAVPSRFVVVDEFPRNSSGKILKRALTSL